MFFGNLVRRIKGKIKDSFLSKELVSAGLYKKSIGVNSIINKKIIFVECFLNEFVIFFEDETVFKIKTDGNFFLGKYDITEFEINELLFRAKKITREIFKERSMNFEDKWDKICNKIKKDEEFKTYEKLKKKFEKGAQ